jgi:hypothetical protein
VVIYEVDAEGHMKSKETREVQSYVPA